MIIISADPGITGALAVFDDTGCINVFDMPTKPKASGKGLQIDAKEIYTLINNVYKIEKSIQASFIETVGTHPGQGVVSAFSFGKSAGIIEGVVGSFDIPIRMVSPQTWKARAGLIGTKKDAARILAIDLCPEIKDKLTLKKHSGRADAILIGMYGN